MLYDYNLTVGDTFKFSPDNGISKFAHIVASIDTVMIGNIPHRLWEMNSVLNDTNYIQATSYFFFEGLGCSTEALFPAFPFYFEFTSDLYCFETQNSNPQIIPAKTSYSYSYIESPQTGIKTTGSSFDNLNSCNYLTSLISVTTDENKITIYPQPAREKVTAQFTGKIEKGKWILRNMIGTSLTGGTIHNQHDLTILRNNLPGGIYLLEIWDSNTYSFNIMKVILD